MTPSAHVIGCSRRWTRRPIGNSGNLKHRDTGRRRKLDLAVRVTFRICACVPFQKSEICRSQHQRSSGAQFPLKPCPQQSDLEACFRDLHLQRVYRLRREMSQNLVRRNLEQKGNTRFCDFEARFCTERISYYHILLRSLQSKRIFL